MTPKIKINAKIRLIYRDYDGAIFAVVRVQGVIVDASEFLHYYIAK